MVALAGVVLEIESASLSVAVNPPAGMVLIRFPAVVEVTRTVMVHDPGVDPTCGGTMPPLRDMLVPPPTAVTAPPQVLAVTFEGLMLIPGWTPTRLSLKAALEKSWGYRS